MYSAVLLYSTGLLVSLANICLWVIVLRSQLKQLGQNKMNERIKISLLIFGFVSLFSNITPIWFDIYQLTRHAHPTNIGFAYVVSQYMYRTITAFMFYLIYRA